MLDCQWQANLRAVTIIANEENSNTTLAGFTIRHCVHKEGAAVLISGVPSTQLLIDLEICYNNASYSAGAVMWSFVSPSIINCRIHHNRAYSASAIAALSSQHFVISNSSFYDNVAEADAGVMRTLSSSGSVIGCAFLRNMATTRSGVGAIQMSDIQVSRAGGAMAALSFVCFSECL